MSPSRARRQHNRTKTARPRPVGSFLRVPVEAGAQAGDDSYGDELLTPVLTTRGDARAKTPTFSVSAEVSRESPQLAEDDIVEIKDFLARKAWIDDKIKVRTTSFEQHKAHVPIHCFLAVREDAGH